MRIYIFKSEAGTGLRAFAGEPAGSKLPDQFRPWHAVGGHSSREGSSPQPVSRDDREGHQQRWYQLWRVKALAVTA